jgi:hypothetical protein
VGSEAAFAVACVWYRAMDQTEQEERAKVGLCADCRHARRVKSDRGSVFWRCELSVSDPSFPKYPRLPVRECRGYEAAGTPEGDWGDARSS